MIDPSFMEEFSRTAILVVKRSAGVAPRVNLRERVTCTLLPSANSYCVLVLGMLSKSSLANAKGALGARTPQGQNHVIFLQFWGKKMAK